MPRFHVIFKDRSGPGPRSLSFVAADAGQALSIAQRQPGEAEIWCEEEFLCSVEQSSSEQGFWMISSDRKHGGAFAEPQDAGSPGGGRGTAEHA